MSASRSMVPWYRMMRIGLIVIALSLAACAPPQAVSTPTAVTPTRAAAGPTQVPTPMATTLPAAEKEVAVLQQVAQSACQAPSGAPPQVTVEGATYTLACIFAAGHSTSVRLQRFGSAAEAQTAFRDAAKDHPTQDFHGYTAAAWEEKAFETPTAKRRLFVWPADRWLVRIESFDDTAYLVALDPGQVAEVVYQAAIQRGLWPRDVTP